MFFGEYEYRIDEKSRVPLPPKFRRELKEGVILAPGVEKCITAYPVSDQWQEEKGVSQEQAWQIIESVERH